MSKRIFNMGPNRRMEPDDGPRNTPYHRRIVRVKEVANVPIAKVLLLDCGHRVGFIGNPAHLRGRVLCEQCREDRN